MKTFKDFIDKQQSVIKNNLEVGTPAYDKAMIMYGELKRCYATELLLNSIGLLAFNILMEKEANLFVFVHENKKVYNFQVVFETYMHNVFNLFTTAFCKRNAQQNFYRMDTSCAIISTKIV